MNTNLSLWLIAAFVTPLLPANAADPIEEIIVSADFRGRALDEVPFSVSVLDAELIDALAVQHFEELVNVVPNMNWSGDGHRARYFQIRGVGELEQYQGAPNPSIGFVIDDIDFSGIGTIATLFDIESVEVLRGPQGSRYGANALGGLIYAQSVAPSSERSGRLQISAGNDNALSVGAALGGSLNAEETTVMRISAQKYESDGFRSNSYLNRDDSNRRDELSIRAKLHLEPGDSFSAKLAVLYSDIDNGYDAFALDNSYTVLSDKPGQDAQMSLGASMRLDWGVFEDVTVTSITSVAASDITFSFDADWGNDDSWAPFVYDYVSLTNRERDTVSQEFRIGKDKWLLGLYALKLDEQIESLNRGEYFDPFFPFSDSLLDPFASQYEATNVAIFGQYVFAFSATTELSTGLRIEHRSSNYSDSNAVRAGPSETMWGGEISLTHKIGDSSRIYATLSKGYKAGGFNLGPAPPGKQEFSEETMWTIEAGLKGRWFDQRLQMSAALFHNIRPDQQVRSTVQLDPGDPASFVFFTDNIVEGEALGLEADIRIYASDSWEFYTTIGLLDAAFDSGRQQAHAPRFTFAGGAVYRNENGLFARLDATAKDDFYFDVSHDQQSQKFELLNAKVGFESENWLVSVWARNVLDEEYAVRGFYFGNEPPDFPNTLYTRFGDPRQYGVTIERRF